MEDFLQSRNIGKIKMLKLDFEGCEPDLFESISESLLQNIEYLIVEAHFFDQRSKERWNIIEKRLKKHIDEQKLEIIIGGDKHNA